MIFQNIKDIVKEGNDFRRVLMTGGNQQIVAMSLMPGEDIGEEVHPDIDQFFYVFEGEGEAILDGQVNSFEKHDAILVPKGTTHNIKNTASENLKLLTIYAPPAHPDGTVHATKEDALKAEE